MSEARQDTGYSPAPAVDPGLCRTCRKPPANGVLVSVAPAAVRDTYGPCAGDVNARQTRGGR